MLETKNLGKTYLNKGKTTAALKNISLSFPSTSLIVLSGQSGSGKTTLLNILGGMDSPTEGTFSFEGLEIERKTVDSFRKNSIGFVFQDYNLIEDASIRGNLNMAFEINGRKPDEKLIAHYLKLVRLPDENESLEELLIKKPNELSGGQRQRVAIARALIKEPSVLLLDEPTGSLDKDNSISLIKVLKDISKNRLVLLSTHDMDVARPYADRIISLKNGEVIDDKTIISPNETEPNQDDKRKGSTWYSLLCSLKTAFRGMLKNPIRLISSIILSSLACGGLGVALSLNTADEGKISIRTQYEQSDKKFFFVGSLSEKLENGEAKKRECSFSKEQREKLTAFNGGNEPIYLSKSGVQYDRSSVIGRSSFNSESPYARFLFTSYDYVMEIDEEANQKNGVLTKSELLSEETMCRLPENYGEIALTDMQADYLYRYGYYNTENKEEVLFSSFDEIIGQKIDGLSITGIFKTEENIMDWFALDDLTPGKNKDADSKEMRLAAGYSPGKYLIAKPGFSRDRGKQPTLAMLRLSGNLKNELALRSSLSYDSADAHYSCYLAGRYSGFSSRIQIISDFAKVVIFGVITCFVVIEMILSLNFFHTNIKEMERELGIMKALGAKKSTTITTIFTQGFIIAAIEFILSLVVCAIGNLIFNLKLSISILELSAIPFLGMLALIVLTMLIVSSFSSLKALTKKPIDIIENK
ncbi:MAG: ATP-binding cassette domain-containing protein [Bacilli bacterium]|nr:ATP-binding cassette domain-containing protein [Bacilli bacterium]